MAWGERSHEERTLLNPAFCAMLLWWASRGCADVREEGMSFEEAFLVLPLVIQGKVRHALPRDTRTSLAVWINRYPLALGTVANSARALVPFTKDGVLWGGRHGLTRISGGWLQADEGWHGVVHQSLGEGSDETRLCARRASFVGRWFARAGSPSTVLALLGVRV